MLDIEPHRFMTDPKKMVREAKAFCNEIKRYYGTNPIIYCSTNFYETYLHGDFKAKNYPLWIADYRGCPSWTGKSGSIPIRIRFPAYGARSTGTSSEAVNKNFKS